MPYPTCPCVVIGAAVPFMGFLVQLEPFDYSKINIYQQRATYELLFEESSYREIPAQLSIMITLLKSMVL